MAQNPSLSGLIRSKLLLKVRLSQNGSDTHREVLALVDTHSDENIISRYAFERPTEMRNTAILEPAQRLYSQGLPLYCDSSPTGSAPLRISFDEGASTTSEAYAYQAEFVILGFLLPFQCIIGASLARQAGLCFERFQMPLPARNAILRHGTTTMESLYDRSFLEAPDAPQINIRESLLRHILEREREGLSGCFISLGDPLALSSFVTHEFIQGESVRDIVTLTGHLPNIWAATCEEYVFWRWPWVSQCVLHLVDLIIQCQWELRDEHYVTEVALDDTLTSNTEGNSGLNVISLDFTVKKGAELVASGNPLLLADVLEALAWFCAVLRVSRGNQPLQSVIELQILSSPSHGQMATLVQAPLPTAAYKDDVGWDRLASENVKWGIPSTLQSLHDSSLTTPPMQIDDRWTKSPEHGHCWYSLFPHGAVAIGFPTPARPNMQGLELSFMLTSHICGLEYSAFHGDDFVLRGQSTALYPITLSNGCVQWHLSHLAGAASGFEELGQDSLGVNTLKSIVMV